MFQLYAPQLTANQTKFALGCLTFSVCVTVISCKIQLIEMHDKSVMAAISLVLSIGGWFLWNIILSATYSNNANHYVKDALLASGVIDSRPKTDLARDAASELVNNYGFKRLSITDPFAAPVGSVLVYGTARSVGHVEIRTKDGFVSDFRSPTPSRRPLMGVYAKL